MKITISKSQWEQIGKKAGWASDVESHELSDLPLFDPRQLIGSKYIVTTDLIFDGNTWYPHNKPDLTGPRIDREHIYKSTILVIVDYDEINGFGIKKNYQRSVLDQYEQIHNSGFDMETDNLTDLIEMRAIKRIT